MKLTKNFSLAELTKSQTAERLGISNESTQNKLLGLLTFVKMFYKR